MTNTHTRIRTTITSDGNSYVQLMIGDVLLNLTADAAADVGLSLVAAASSARAEKATYMYCIQEGIDPAALLKQLRSQN